MKGGFQMSDKKVVFKCKGKYYDGCEKCILRGLYHKHIISTICVKNNLHKGDVITITVNGVKK
jgi:hypothetical protein